MDVKRLWMSTAVAAWMAAGAAPVKAQAPAYTAQSVVSSASGAGRLAPNTIATVYGTDLSWNTVILTADRISANQLPTALPPSGVKVLIGGLLACLYYVSPTQVNFLIPSNLAKGTVSFQLVRDGWAGPKVDMALEAAAPGLYQADDKYAIAVHLDGSLLTQQAPGLPGEVVVLFATGLGDTSPSPLSGELAPGAARVRSGVQVLLEGQAVPQDRVLYAGLTPGFAGLYQVNLRIPDELAADPEIRLLTAGQTSREGVRLLARVP